jgi:hypothetical protein
VHTEYVKFEYSAQNQVALNERGLSLVEVLKKILNAFTRPFVEFMDVSGYLPFIKCIEKGVWWF